jgi:hypothetical protein
MNPNPLSVTRRLIVPFKVATWALSWRRLWRNPSDTERGHRVDHAAPRARFQDSIFGDTHSRGCVVLNKSQIGPPAAQVHWTHSISNPISLDQAVGGGEDIKSPFPDSRRVRRHRRASRMLSEMLWGGYCQNRSMTSGGNNAMAATTDQADIDVTPTVSPAAHAIKTQTAARAVL